MGNRLKYLALSGVIAVGFYLLHVILGGILWEGYNHLARPISDLTATGAPHRGLLSVFTTLYGIFSLSFAVTLYLVHSRAGSRLLRAGLICFILLHLVSFSYAFFPEDLPGRQTTPAGIMHMVITALIVPLSIVSPLLIGTGFRRRPGRKKLGTYSLISGILVFLFGTATVVAMAEKLPVFGLFERLNIGTLLLWMVVLSVYTVIKGHNPRQ